MDERKKELPLVFDSSDVTQLVGIPSFNLNSFVERKLYGIAPSVRSETGRGGRRIFSDSDVLGIGLVWWLFESGLRSEVLQRVLNQVNDCRREATANDAAHVLVEAGAKVLAVERAPRAAPGKGEDSQVLQCVYTANVERSMKADSKSLNIVLLVPVGNLFARLRKAISEFRR